MQNLLPLAAPKSGITPQQDANLAALLGTDTSAVAIFGKSWDFHVTELSIQRWKRTSA